MKEVITKDILKKTLKISDFWVPLAKRLLKVKRINEVYNYGHPAKDFELIGKGFEFLDIKFDYDKEKLKLIPKEGPFLFISNHPYGFLDGLTSLYIFGQVRKDIKLTANYLLRKLEPIQNLFISVNPFDGKHYKKMGGTDSALEHLQQGHALGLYPAGEVSTYYGKSKQVMDKDWDPKAMRLIQRAQLPVLPICFPGHNSWSFHFLGRIHPVLRTMRIPAEFFKKRGQTITMQIGEYIPFEKISEYSDPVELAAFLRRSVYDLMPKKA
jgi:putative hemolysin